MAPVSNLSLAAQAVLDALYMEELNGPQQLMARAHAAAALRAAADQVLAVQWEGRIEPDATHSLGVNWTRDALHAIATELEAQ
jgi:hypothetical protein